MCASVFVFVFLVCSLFLCYRRHRRHRGRNQGTRPQHQHRLHDID